MTTSSQDNSNNQAQRSQTPARPNAPAPGFSVLVATERAWESEIDQLRIAAYLKAGYFKLPDPEPVRRRSDPQDRFVCWCSGPEKRLRQRPVLHLFAIGEPRNLYSRGQFRWQPTIFPR